MEPQKIKLAVIEDLRDVALSLQTIFNSQPDMECKHIYYNAEDAILFLPCHDADIVIVDIGLPRASGIEAIRTISDKCPNTQFCMFTVYEDDDKIYSSLEAGAKGYILKGASRDKILISVRELYEGGSPMSPTIARRIIDQLGDRPHAQVKKPLPVTERELELLTLLAQGLMYKEIADHMGITTGTVKQHIHKIYDKLQVSNRTEAINKFNGN